MPNGERRSQQQWRHQAVRWRRLAVEATTPHTKSHLLKLAQQCEFLAGDLLPTRTALSDSVKSQDVELADAAG
jgi:hypothetical protein